MRKIIPVILLFVPVFFSGCYHSTGIQAPASIISRVDDNNANSFIGDSPKTMASSGDFYISNNKFDIVVDGGTVGERKQNFLAPTGGSIIDITNIVVDSLGNRISRDNDNINQIFQVVNANLGTPVAYTSIKVDTLSENTSSLKLTGYVMDRDGSLQAAGVTVDPGTKLAMGLQVETIYRIERNDEDFTVTTTVSNGGSIAAPIRTVGDYVFLGGNNLKPYFGAPGLGYCPAQGVTSPVYVPFASFAVHSVPYEALAIYSPDDGVVEVTFDGCNRAYTRSGGQYLTVSKPSHAGDVLAPGESVTFVRHMVTKNANSQYSAAFYAIDKLANAPENPRNFFSEVGGLSGFIYYTTNSSGLIVTVEQLLPGSYFDGTDISASPIPVPYAATRTFNSGSFSLMVPPGRYQIRIQGNGIGNFLFSQYQVIDPGDPDVEGDETVTSYAIDVSANKTTSVGNVVIQQEDSGSIQTTSKDADGNLIPARVTVLPDDPDALVYFGDEEEGRKGSINYFFLFHGDRKIRFLTGGHHLLFSHGPLYALTEETAFVSTTVDDEGNLSIITTPETLEVTMDKVVDPGAYLSCDPLVKTSGSYNCAVSRTNRMMAVFSEGLDVIFAADIDMVSNYEKYTDDLELQYRLETGDKITIDPNTVHVISGTTVKNFVPDSLLQNGFGEFTIFPIKWEKGVKGYGVGETGNRHFATVLDNIQNRSDKDVHAILTNPRAGITLPNGIVSGLFTSMNMPVPATLSDPYFSKTSELGTGTTNGDFGMMEVLAGNDYGQYLMVREDWFSILREGRALIGCGGSGYVVNAPEFVGSPRTWVHYGTDPYDEDTFIQEFSAGHSFVSTGPFLEVTAGDKLPGDTVASSGGAVSLNVKVQAPDWIPVNELRIVVDGVVVQTIDLSTVTGTVRYSGTVQVQVPSTDSYIVVECGMSLADISAGILPGGNFSQIYPNTQPIAFTNPFFVDGDGDGSWH
ncbi:MAG: hypothetical protein GXO70_06220 [Acidobacteria bacterium]|nr:hypothetical protein [Acidobacteriota bacterium]